MHHGVHFGKLFRDWDFEQKHSGTGCLDLEAGVLHSIGMQLCEASGVAQRPAKNCLTLEHFLIFVLI